MKIRHPVDADAEHGSPPFRIERTGGDDEAEVVEIEIVGHDGVFVGVAT